ncbi:MAG: PPC domain-containing protein [Phycisphaerales bacterium]|nr:MAG: PPC domain-containing protein [Phycisphaerales bacterium]
MKTFRWQISLFAAILLTTGAGAFGGAAGRARRSPGIGYVYPAGGQQGATFEAAVAGRYLDGVTDVVVSGRGVRATLIEHVKPLTGKEINLLRDRLKELQKIVPGAKPAKGRGGAGGGAKTAGKPASKTDVAAARTEIAEIRKKLANPKNRNRNNPQLAEDIRLRFVLAPDAEPGERELRLKSALGLSNPVTFHVGQVREHSEKEPNGKTADSDVLSPLPLVNNGRIMPGDVDRFRLKFSRGQRLVMAAGARELIPYLADAVPGWFQATLALYDANGVELAYSDDYRFHPDPVLFYEVARDGEYVLEIKDAIYRGREDFVYRISVGELPFVTSIFPLGGRAGAFTTVTVEGWNLPTKELKLDTTAKGPGILPVWVRKGNLVSNRVPFAVDTLPEFAEKEPNRLDGVQPVTLPVIINGRIGRPGDRDVFTFEGRAGDEVVAEVDARRLDSPLDSVLRLTDGAGRQLAFNDDHADKGAGLTTHHADSLLSVTLPGDGKYYIHLGDAQQKGGRAYVYRLRISEPRPDFELRVAPSSINAWAGATVPVTVHAIRKDGFTGQIDLSLKNPPNGFSLRNARVPAGKDQVQMFLKVPSMPRKQPLSLQLEGRAEIHERQVVRAAVPAEDRMQAFFYRHLVPAKELKVAVMARPKPKARPKKAPAKPKKTSS